MEKGRGAEGAGGGGGQKKRKERREKNKNRRVFSSESIERNDTVSRKLFTLHHARASSISTGSITFRHAPARRLDVNPLVALIVGLSTTNHVTAAHANAHTALNAASLKTGWIEK